MFLAKLAGDGVLSITIASFFGVCPADLASSMMVGIAAAAC